MRRLVVGEPHDRRPFVLDGEVKEERAWFGGKPTRHTTLLDRAARSATARADDEVVTFPMTLDPDEPVVEALAGLVVGAAEHSQVVLTTHDDDLAAALVDAGADLVALRRNADGRTVTS